MPITKSAKKALRQDRRRTLVNQKVRTKMKTSLVKAKADPSQENVSLAYSAIDRAVKKNLLHQNKAARLKSQLALSSKPKA